MNLIKLNKIKNSFKDFVKNSFSDNGKYKKIYNKVEDEIKDKNILPDLKNIAASFIQILYKKHLKKIHSELRIEMLKRLFNNLNDDNIILLLFCHKWKYRINKEKKKEKEMNKNLKNTLNRLTYKIFVNKLKKLIDEYVDYIKIITFSDIIKNIVLRRLFNSIRLKFLLYKIISVNTFKKKNLIKKWNEKCKLMRRRKNIILKITKVIKLHSKKLLMNILKFKKFKLYLLSFVLMKKNK